MRFTFTALSMLLLSGCAAERVYMKAYEEPPLPRSQEALLKPYLGIIIKSINGNDKYAVTPMRAGRTNLDVDISLRPGPTQIIVAYEMYEGNTHTWSKANTVKFNAEPGHRYIIRGYHLGAIYWTYDVEDVTNHPEKWCWYERECQKRGPSMPIPDAERR